MADKITIVLVPGSYSSDDLYFHIRDAVLAKGYDIQTLPLPTVRLGPDDHRTPPTMYDDAEAISQRVEKLADQGRDVIVIGHSYSGAPVVQSCEGLSKVERERDGKPGGLVHVAFFPSVVPSLGQMAQEVLVDVPLENVIPMEYEDDGWLRIDPIDLTRAAFLVFTNLPPEERTEWAKKTRQHSSNCYNNKTTFTSYTAPGVGVSYFLCQNDKLVSPKNQQAGIDMMEKASGKKVAVTTTAGDHAPIISMPEKVVEWIIDIANRSS